MGSKSLKDTNAGPLEANVGKLEAQLRLWKTRINGLAERAGENGAQAKIEYQLSIDDLKAKRAVAQAKVEEFKAAGSDQWEGFKADIEQAWSDLEAAFRELKP